MSWTDFVNGPDKADWAFAFLMLLLGTTIITAYAVATGSAYRAVCGHLKTALDVLAKARGEPFATQSAAGGPRRLITKTVDQLEIYGPPDMVRYAVKEYIANLAAKQQQNLQTTPLPSSDGATCGDKASAAGSAKEAAGSGQKAD